jgi:endonuclease-8
VVLFVRDGARGARTGLDHLGPDLCETDADLDAVVRRARTLVDPSTELGVALLDQRIASGIGNVYKSEACWAERVDPFVTLGVLNDERLHAVFARAASQLRANLGPGRRTTVPGGLAVYGRTRRPCRACMTPIRSRRQGEHARTTYWCPTCQPDARR